MCPSRDRPESIAETIGITIIRNGKIDKKGNRHMLKRVLFVDDEPNVLQAFERQFRKQFEIHTAVGPQRGLQSITENGPFSVIVSDLRMPGMDGVEFLSRARQMAPETVRVMLTGQADISATIAAVNQGNIFQFLTKPCSSEILSRVLDSAFEQYRLITAERELLEQTLRGSIGVMSDILSLVNPIAFSRTIRTRRYVAHMAQKLNLADQWQFDLAAMLSQIGCVAVPEELLKKLDSGGLLDSAEQEILAAQKQVGHDLLARIPRLEMIAEMVARQDAPRQGMAGVPKAIAVGAQLLKVALDFDGWMRAGGTVDQAISSMRGRQEYNQSFVAALDDLQAEDAKRTTQLVSLAQLKPQMITNVDVRSRNGLLLLAKGQEVTDSSILRLKAFAITVGVVEPISVLLPPA
jgi:response regulator RpfG family c-di-GMP phosphodiesterase